MAVRLPLLDMLLLTVLARGIPQNTEHLLATQREMVRLVVEPTSRRSPMRARPRVVWWPSRRWARYARNWVVLRGADLPRREDNRFALRMDRRSFVGRWRGDDRHPAVRSWLDQRYPYAEFQASDLATLNGVPSDLCPIARTGPIPGPLLA